MIYRVFLLIWLLPLSLFAGVLGLIDIDEETLEVRLAAVLEHTNGKVVLKKCADPVKDFPANCEQTGTPLSYTDSFKPLAQQALKITPISNEEELKIKKRRETLTWFRSQLRRKIQRGDIPLSWKDMGEQQLQDMVDKIDPDGIVRAREKAEAIFQSIEEALLADEVTEGETNETFFKSLEKDAFESALFPFQQEQSPTAKR